MIRTFRRKAWVRKWKGRKSMPFNKNFQQKILSNEKWI